MVVSPFPSRQLKKSNSTDGPEQPLPPSHCSSPLPSPSSPFERPLLNLSVDRIFKKDEVVFTSATDTKDPVVRLRKERVESEFEPQEFGEQGTRTTERMPRNHNGATYDRLEGGFTSIPLEGSGGMMMNKSLKRFTWKKAAVGVVAFIGLVWVFGPRMGGAKGGSYSGYAPGPTGHTGTEMSATTIGGGVGGVGVYHPDIDDDLAAASSPQDQYPTSYETDPNPSKTTYCTHPHTSSSSSSSPLVQYALMIDAGSTGSRIHIYKFNNCLRTPSFEYEVFKMTQPGLSSYAHRSEGAAKSLDVLLDEAVRVVPEELRGCTPVAVKATAGLRLLPGTQSAEILSAVEKRIKEVYPFKLVEKDGVVIMDGKDEGVYAWITTNYLMGTIKESARANESTYAVLDLGGASTQIVFEPTFEREIGDMEEGEHKYDLKFAQKNHVLYQHSYLGYGLMRARMHVHRLVDFMSSLRASGSKDGGNLVGNPCLAKGTRRTVKITEEKTGEERNVTMGGEDVGSFEGCNRLMQLVLAKDAVCELKPCSFNGVYQPSLLTSFPSGKVVLLSYFYDRLQPLLPPSSPEPVTVSTLASVARDVCQGRSRWLERWGVKPEVMAELEDRPEWCLDLTFMYTLLRLGYEFEDGREVKLGKKIGGTELGWCLGAMIAMVGGGGELSCRV
ncbi:hypothetical protein AX15_003854 [Amanita polypyramis BW_CC]|nr:hypothetical protein AX15_003854 [Amanita polypyramis BW_CC]